MSNLQNYRIFRWWPVDKLKFSFNQLTSLLFHAVLPYKDINYYLRYFAICSKLSVQKDVSIKTKFKLFFLLVVYLSLLNIAFYYFPFSTLVRIILVDAVFILQIGQQFYLIYAGIICYSVYIHWALYIGGNCKLNLIAEKALVGDINHLPVAVRFIRFENAVKQAKFRRWALAFTNSMQGFIFLMDIFLFIFVTALVSTLLSNFSLFVDINLTVILLLFPVFLFHLLLLFVFWISFGHTFCFMATYGFVVLAYCISLFKQNYVLLEKALKLTFREHFNFCCFYYLKSAFRQNLHLFLATFIGDAFFGPLFTVYLAAHLPLSSFFIVQIAFEKVTGLVRLIAILMAMETFVGALVLHLGVAFVSIYAHKGGKLLLFFTAVGSIQKQKLPVKMKLHLYTHIQRLVVHKKIGITYSGKYFIFFLSF